uniref:Uncharacterized protein n=1 Tax=Acrobeloides nanus TaxID=290746 RepID=A0A914EQC7_9BILA
MGFAQMFDVFSNSLISAKPKTNILDISLEERAEHLQALSCARRNFVLGTTSNGGFYPNGNTPKTNNVAMPRRSLFRSYVAFLDALTYPFIMLLLLLLTVFSVSMVLINTLGLLFGYRALPEYVQYMEVHSRHTFGIFGALVEVTLIVYVMVASLIGVYSLPLLCRMKPEVGKTSLSGIIANCMMILMLSSALPVLARTLGITSFDLLGAYGRLDWISNFSLIWSYNVLFAATSIFLLANKFTAPVRRELFRRLCEVTRRRTSLKND